MGEERAVHTSQIPESSEPKDSPVWAEFFLLSSLVKDFQVTPAFIVFSYPLPGALSLEFHTQCSKWTLNDHLACFTFTSRACSSHRNSFILFPTHSP